MDRRYFLKKTWEKGTLMTTGIVASGELLAARLEKTPTEPFARRPLGKTGEQLSILGFGGILVMSVEQSFANNMVAEAVDRGINYFDVSPDYGDAEERLGPALQPYRRRSFLACKTNFRDKAGAMADLDTSLKHLRTDYFDLYQHHALTKAAEVDKILGPNGAMETFVAAQKAGKVRYLGFSCHSVENGDRRHGRRPLRHNPLPHELRAVFQSQLRSAGARTRTPEGHGVPGDQSHGQGQVSGEPA